MKNLKKQYKKKLYNKATTIVEVLNSKKIIISIAVYNKKGNVLFVYNCEEGIGNGEKIKASIALYISNLLYKDNSKFKFDHEEVHQLTTGEKGIFKYYKLKG